jgi:FMN phosphatase YigB (HAD superfamily)
MSTATPIKFVYFDVGGVLLAFYHTLGLLPNRWGIDPKEYLTLMKSVEHARANGSMTETEVERRLITRFGARIPRNYWASGQFVELFTPITEMHEVAHELESTYRLGLLTNVSETVWQRSQQDFAYLFPSVKFEQVVASYAVKSAKPEKRIYEIAIERTGLQPAEICFIDDMPANLETARALGMQTIQSYPAEIHRTVAEAHRVLLAEELKG